MLGLTIKVLTQMNSREVTRRATPAKFRGLQHAAASIRKTAVESIQPGEEPSAPGTPPHTHPRGGSKRGRLPRAIRFAVEDENTAVIGPRASVVGEGGAAHEHGASFRGDQYPQRPFMQPALTAAIPRFASSWQASIGG